MRINAKLQISDIFDYGLTADDTYELFKTYKNAYINGTTVEDTINLLSKQIEPKQGVESKSIAKQFIGLLIAPTPLTLYGMAISFYTELGYNLIDQANFVSMRMYFNFRMYDRMNYKYKIG